MGHKYKSTQYSAILYCINCGLVKIVIKHKYSGGIVNDKKGNVKRKTFTRTETIYIRDKKQLKYSPKCKSDES